MIIMQEISTLSIKNKNITKKFTLGMSFVM